MDRPLRKMLLAAALAAASAGCWVPPLDSKTTSATAGSTGTSATTSNQHGATTSSTTTTTSGPTGTVGTSGSTGVGTTTSAMGDVGSSGTTAVQTTTGQSNTGSTGTSATTGTTGNCGDGMAASTGGSGGGGTCSLQIAGCTNRTVSCDVSTCTCNDNGTTFTVPASSPSDCNAGWTDCGWGTSPFGGGTTSSNGSTGTSGTTGTQSCCYACWEGGGTCSETGPDACSCNNAVGSTSAGNGSTGTTGTTGQSTTGTSSGGNAGLGCACTTDADCNGANWMGLVCNSGTCALGTGGAAATGGSGGTWQCGSGSTTGTTGTTGTSGTTGCGLDGNACATDADCCVGYVCGSGQCGAPATTGSQGTSTPLVFVFDAQPVSYTDAPGQFELARPGSGLRTDWPTARTPWLALDRDGSGTIDDGRELFGSMTVLPDGRTARNGFEALAALDANHDGQLDARDPAFARLVLWADRDGDRRSAKGELTSLASARIVSISLAYATGERCDARGNCERERAPFIWADAYGTLHRGEVVDVHLRNRPLALADRR